MDNTKYISQFAENKMGFQEWMERNKEFSRAAMEMCEEMNLKLMPACSVDADFQIISFVSQLGLPAGSLRYNKIYHGPNSGEFVFTYQGPRVCKQKGANKNQRSAKRITGIISSLKRNDEIPNETYLIRQEHPSLRYAFTSTKVQREAYYDLSMSQLEQAALLKAYFAKNYEYIEAHREKYETQYNNMCAAEEKIRKSAGVFDRFAAGSTAIGVRAEYNPYGPDQVFYLVGRASYELETPRLENIVRYNSLAGSPVAADAAIIRTYMAHKVAEPFGQNELGIKREDMYHDEIDVAMGFAHSTSTVWLLIPDVAE